jgi:hypothetical protein
VAKCRNGLNMCAQMNEQITVIKKSNVVLNFETLFLLSAFMRRSNFTDVSMTMYKNVFIFLTYERLTLIMGSNKNKNNNKVTF